MLEGQAFSMMNSLGIVIVCIMAALAMLAYRKVIRKKSATRAAAPAATDDDELIAVIAAAIRCYEQDKKKPSGIHLARNFKS